MTGTADPIRVLHVDDEPGVTDRAQTFLERADERITVRTAASAEEGWETLSDTPVDCVVSEYDMGGTNGLDFLERVREAYPELPFILYTGKGSEEVASEAISKGVTDYLQKERGTEQYSILANRVTDVTEQTECEQELTEIKRRYRTIFNDPNILVGHLDTDGTLLDVNRTAMKYIDATREDVIGELFPETPWLDHSEAARAKVRERIDRAVSGEYVEFEADRVRPNGERYAVKGVFRPVTDDNGAVESLLISTRDITDSRVREAELQSQRDRYQSLFENSPRVIWEQDHSEAMAYLETITPGVDDVEAYLLDHPEEIDRLLDRVEIIDVNRNALAYYDADSKAELLENVEQVMVEETSDSLAAQWAAFADGATEYQTETVAQTLSGDRREELLHIVAPDGNTDDYSRVYVIGTEITEQKERERRLKRQNERLDEFTSVVSHDLRTPLHVAASRLKLAAEECDSPHLESVADAHDRMERLIEDLLAFARAGSEALACGTVELGQLLDGCWERIRTDEASLAVETDEAIQADRGRLRQLFENLLANAVEHGGSDVSITVGSLADGFYIEDDGSGIPESKRDDVLEAGHSTSQEGTGFGLSIVAEVAEAHGWALHVTDGSDGGARFEVTGVEFTAG
mgnify:CR=1 FL=1